jgi:putative oxidoreductase
MKVATIIIRTLLGLLFVLTGGMILFHPMQPPTPPPPLAMAFSGALTESHYIWVIGALQLVGGLLLLIGRYVPLGLTLLGPVIVNIALFHIFLDPSGLPMVAVISAMTLFLLWRYRSAFAGLVQP